MILKNYRPRILQDGGKTLRPAGDPYEYQKVGDSYYTRKKSSKGSWIKTSGEAKAHIRAAVFSETGAPAEDSSTNSFFDWWSDEEDAPEIAPKDVDDRNVYVSKSGDSVAKVAVANRVKVADILAANAGMRNGKLPTGTELFLPEAEDRKSFVRAVWDGDWETVDDKLSIPSSVTSFSKLLISSMLQKTGALDSDKAVFSLTESDLNRLELTKVRQAVARAFLNPSRGEGAGHVAYNHWSDDADINKMWSEPARQALKKASSSEKALAPDINLSNTIGNGQAYRTSDGNIVLLDTYDFNGDDGKALGPVDIARIFLGQAADSYGNKFVASGDADSYDKLHIIGENIGASYPVNINLGSYKDIITAQQYNSLPLLTDKQLGNQTQLQPKMEVAKTYLSQAPTRAGMSIAEGVMDASNAIQDWWENY